MEDGVADNMVESTVSCFVSVANFFVKLRANLDLYICPLYSGDRTPIGIFATQMTKKTETSIDKREQTIRKQPISALPIDV